jgi:hypothetical protein
MNFSGINSGAKRQGRICAETVIQWQSQIREQPICSLLRKTG